MQAILVLKLKPITVEQTRQEVKVPRGRMAKLNSAISKFVTFHTDEKLVQMDSPYRWVQ